MKILYLDESGCNNIQKISRDYPIFMLGGAIVDSEDCAYNKKLIDQFKLKYFNTTSIILHSSEIIHKNNAYTILQDPAVNKHFISNLNELMKKLKYKVIVCIIDLPKYAKQHEHNQFDLYHYALTVLIEKFIYELKNLTEGRVFCESRNKVQDAQILKVFDVLKNHGTHYVPPEEIQQKIKHFNIIPKSANYTGLQIADLVLSPIGRHYLGKTTYEDYDIVYSKCVSKKGEKENIGITVIPPQKKGRKPETSVAPMSKN